MRRLATFVAVSLIAASCSGSASDPAGESVETVPEATIEIDDPVEAPDTTPATTEESEPAADAAPTSVLEPAGEPEFAGTLDVEVEDPDRCEVIGERCLLPFPSDALTVDDPTTSTGRRVALADASVPMNADGVPIGVARQNRNDGFSPGAAALVFLADVDPGASGMPPVTDIGRSLEPDSGTVIIDATTGEVWPHWVETDSNAATVEERGMFLRPAVNYPEGHRIVVAIRGAVDGSGESIEPTDAFRAYRDRLETDVAEIEERRPAMEQVFADLDAAGVGRDDLVLAWDFTVISTENLTGPLLHMRDDAFEQLGSAAPSFSVTSAVEDFENGNRIVIDGTYEVPLYLAGDGAPGSALNLVDDPDLPTRNGSWTAPFRCQITTATSAGNPGAALVYGHGLLGSERQVTSAGPTLLAENHNYVVCGTPLIGMAEEDTGNAAASLIDPSNFATLVDRLLQGHLNTLFLGRLMIHPDGLVSDPAFVANDGSPLIETSELYYYGISQGGIMGPVSTAISLDWDRGVFGVPGVNYSTLLNRSVDFDTFQQILDPAFPDKLDQAVMLLLIQMLWDRGEGNGYVSHYGDAPLPGVNEKQGLIQGALGDFQVANVAMDVMARTMGASVGADAARVRSTDVEPFWGIPRIESYPFDGSAVVLFDSGTAVPPITNTPPREGVDPHEDVRRAAAAYDQIAAFLQPDGAVTDTCNSGPCVIEPRD